MITLIDSKKARARRDKFGEMRRYCRAGTFAFSESHANESRAVAPETFVVRARLSMKRVSHFHVRAQPRRAPVIAPYRAWLSLSSPFCQRAKNAKHRLIERVRLG